MWFYCAPSAGKDAYDNRKEKKLRCPAWCDRVLWRIGKHSATAAVQFEGEAADGEVSGDSDGDIARRSGRRQQSAAVPESAPSQAAHEGAELTLNCGADSVSGKSSTSSGRFASPALSPKSPVTASDVAGAISSMSGMAGAQTCAETSGGCEESVELMEYDRCPNRISDHKPVRALLNLRVKRCAPHLFLRLVRRSCFSCCSGLNTNRGIICRSLRAEWTGRPLRQLASPSTPVTAPP